MCREKMARNTTFSVLNSSFVAESGVGSRYMDRVINFIKCQDWEKSERRLPCVIYKL